MILTTLYLDTTRTDARRDLHAPYDMHRTLTRCTEDDPRPLFRIDRGNGCVRMVTDIKPALTALESGYAVNARTVEYGAEIITGNRYEFRLWASPTVQRHIYNGRGKRHNIVGVPAQLEWLHRQAERGGFTVMDANIRQSFSIGGDPKRATHEAKQSIPHVGVEFEGLLRVEDSVAFRKTLRQGIGRAKVFGFGLLLIDV